MDFLYFSLQPAGKEVFTSHQEFGTLEFNTDVDILFVGFPEKKFEGAVKTSAEVEKYIAKQKSPQKEIVQRLRNTILKTLPDIKEEVKMGVPWYEGKFYIVALRDHVNLGFSVQGLSEQEKTLFEGKGKMMRHVKFYSLVDVDEARVVKLLRLVAEKSACRYG